MSLVGKGLILFLPQEGSITVGTAKFFPIIIVTALRVVDGSAVQAAVTPPAPSFPLYDDEVQGEFVVDFLVVFFLMVPPSVNLSFLPGFSNPNLYCSRRPAQSIRERSSQTLNGKKDLAITVVPEMKTVWVMVLVKASCVEK